MPDLISVLIKRWKFILGLTLVTVIVAYIFVLLSPKKYLAAATALPVNSLTADRARFFNENIEALYSDFGAPEDLDRMEGTGALDTIFIAAADELNLAAHYHLDANGEAFYKAALQLKKNTRINRSGFGELKIRVWDKDRDMAAAMANTLLRKIQQLHQRLQNENSVSALQQINAEYAKKESQFRQVSDSLSSSSGPDAEILQARKTVLLAQLQQYEKLSDQYQLAISTNPQALLTVESARAPLWPDQPKTLPTVLLCGFAAFAFSYLIAIFVESRNAAR